MSNSPPPNSQEIPFEEALRDLEGIVERLESGSLGLEQSLRDYEQGVKRLRQCHERLQAFERRVEILTGFNAAGEPVTEPFPANDGSLERLENEAGVGSKSESRPTTKRRAVRKDDLDAPSGLF
jgi:exodeoxyribonuclease VII small subunit